jgi:GT2 family glycosyltransferase
MVSPAISVIVSTRNRQQDILPCVQTILENPGTDFELVVVDQSDTNESRRLVEGAISDERLRWIDTPTRGLSRSRNVAVSAARAPLLTFTDDDCRVPRDWVAGVRRIFDEDPEVSLVFGRAVRPEDSPEGFAAEFEPEAEQIFWNAYPDICGAWGVGANMAMRRSLLDRIGPFDPVLGAGAPFVASEDLDIAIRTVAAGLKMLYTRRISVTHLGVREGADASKLMRGYGIGMGATLAKHLRLGTKGSPALWARWLSRNGLRVLRNALQGRRPTGAAYVLFGLKGAVRGSVRSIDGSLHVYGGSHDFTGKVPRDQT